MTDNPLHDNMLNGDELILINSEDNPKYRILVQTPGELDYSDIGIGKINYKEEAIKEAMNTLIGHDVVDELTEHERKLGLTPKPFAHIYNADYCPKFGGYADIEVFNSDYEPVLENMLKHKDTTKRKFSTEVEPIDILNSGDNDFDLNKYKYDGLVMTTKPRDPKTGLCDIIVNSKDFKEDETVTDEIKLTKEQYEELLGAKAEKEDLLTKYNKGKALYEGLKPEDFKEYQELQTEKESLYNQLVPIWTAQEGEKLELVNSLVEKYPEAEREDAKTRFDKMEIEDLKLINSVQPTGTPAPGAVGTGGRPEGQTNNELTDEQLDNLMKQAGKA